MDLRPQRVQRPVFWMTVAKWIFGKELHHQNNPVLRAVSDMIAQSVRNSIRQPSAPRMPKTNRV